MNTVNSPTERDDPSSLRDRLSAHPRFEAWLGIHDRYELTRFVVLRLLGFVLTAAFASLVIQLLPLLGADGLTPAQRYVDSAVQAFGSPFAACLKEPSLFFFFAPSDGLLLSLGILGLALSVLVLLGVTNALVMLMLWALYRSFVAIGQLWYGYGWELLLVETTFLAMFLCPLTSFRPFPKTRAPLAVIWLLRWLACRVMLGAGLIKLRGDACWVELTCLDFHFETQPLPNPLSPYLHFLPHWVHAGGVLFNHLCELVLPLCIFGPRRLRAVSGALMIAFQITLILSGNLAFLNWLSIVPMLAAFDDRMLARITPRALRELGQRALDFSRPQRITAAVYAGLVALLSIEPTLNLLSPRQRMNGAYEPLMLVNTYGAFGSVGRQRHELILEGTRDDPQSKSARYQPYEFPAKPGDPKRSLPVVSPLQPRLDWQIWFAAMASPAQEPFVLELVWKLLHADKSARALLAHDPFGAKPPRAIRVLRYRYRFARPSSDAVWERELEGVWLPPLTRDGPLRDALVQLGYIEP